MARNFSDLVYRAGTSQPLQHSSSSKLVDTNIPLSDAWTLLYRFRISYKVVLTSPVLSSSRIRKADPSTRRVAQSHDLHFSISRARDQIYIAGFWCSTFDPLHLFGQSRCSHSLPCFCSPILLSAGTPNIAASVYPCTYSPKILRIARRVGVVRNEQIQVSPDLSSLLPCSTEDIPRLMRIRMYSLSLVNFNHQACVYPLLSLFRMFIVPSYTHC